MRMKGHWIGEYAFGPEYAHSPDPVRFELHLEDRWPGRFCGVVQDDPMRGMPEEGRVVGWQLFGRVRFEKLMPVNYAFAESGDLVSMREFYCKDTGQDPGEIPHPPVIYTGRFTGAGQRELRGRWKIRGDVPGTGTWWARKAEL
jgi:hypothetical protein